MIKKLLKYPLLQLLAILLRKDLRGKLLCGDWGYIYFTHLSKFSNSNNSKETLIELSGPDVGNVTHTGLCAPACQCSDALTLRAITQIS